MTKRKRQTYQVHFESDAGWAVEEIKARSPGNALEMAHRMVARNEIILESYDPPLAKDVNAITVHDAGENEVARWRDRDLLLRLAADGLFEAAKRVLANWETGDLAAAVRELAAAVAEAEGRPSAQRSCKRS